MTGSSAGDETGGRSLGVGDVLGGPTDVWCVADAGGELVRWNEALSSVDEDGDGGLAGTSVGELFGGDVAAMVERAARDRRSISHETTVVTRAGVHLPCELAVEPVTNGRDEEALVVVVRGVSDDQTLERQPSTATSELDPATTDLERLYAASTRLYGVESLSACFAATIEAAVDILGFDWCTMAAPAADGERFEVVAVSAEAPVEEGDRHLRLDEGIAGQVYETGVSVVIDDVRTVAASRPVSDELRAGLTVSVGDWGVFQAAARTPAAFDARDRQFAEMLMTSVASTLDRIERETQLREQQAELTRQNERLEEFTGVVSHDLRSPLNVLRGTLSRAEETGDPEQLTHCFAAIDRMERLIEDLLVLSADGAVIDELRRVELTTVARRCWQTVETADATLRLEADVTIRADDGRLGQLLGNLFRNAVDHGGTDVTVTISALESGFAVEDDGPGIPTESRERVFETGYTTGDDGTGLGLNIVEQVVEAHGWSIAVTDGADGGARFEICGVDRLV